MSKYLFRFIYKHIVLTAILCLGYGVTYTQSRPIDGYGYNELNPQWGAVGDIQPRMSPADFADGISLPKMGEEFGKINPRIISNILFDQKEQIGAGLNLSDLTWAFGQFVDHDIVFSNNGSEFLDNIIIPSDDIFFSPGDIMWMSRSEPAQGTGTSVTNPRNYENKITAFLDLSNVYGSSIERANWLRSFKDGKLKVSKDNNLPWNTTNGEFNSNVDPNAPDMIDDTHSLVKMFVAGDVRANENPLLITLHTIYVREHNRLCDAVKERHPGYNDERIYQMARKWNIALYQSIIFKEWLPTMGVNLPSYHGYKENVNPQILNEFSTAAFRMGHTLLNSTIIRMDNNGNEIKTGNIALKDAFFNPYLIDFAGGVDSYVTGMATQVQQEYDCKIVDDVRNFLFGAPGEGGLDLGAININRGRERGVADFNTIRTYLGMPPYSTFEEMKLSDEATVLMKDIYGDINNIDAWVGMLSEVHVNNGLFGSVVTTLLERQFQALREGDRFYFENLDFTVKEVEEINAVKLRDVLMRNTNMKVMQDDVFVAMPHGNIEGGPDIIPFPLEAVIYPNPVLDDLQLKVYASRDEQLNITIVNYMGKVVKQSSLPMYEGSNILNVNIFDCPRGYYNVILDTEYRRNVLKMIKK